MQDHDIESLNHLRAVYTDRIDRFRSPQAERSFREYASAVTSSQPRDDVRIQSSRRSEQAERYVDMILEWERRIDEKCGDLEKIVSRIDQAIREHEKYLTYSKALRWIFEDEIAAEGSQTTPQAPRTNDTPQEDDWIPLPSLGRSGAL